MSKVSLGKFIQYRGDIMPNIIPERKKLKIKKDEHGIPYYVDTRTSNISFLQTAADLKKLGIKNNTFFLRIYNRDLIGVNPYDPAITKGMIQAMILECKLNPYYFLREIARVPEQGGAVGIGSGSPYILHRGNLAMTFCVLHNIDCYVLLPRQCFKTISAAAIILWLYLFGLTNSQFNFLNKAQADTDLNLKRIRSLKDLLPIWIQQNYSFIEDDGSGDRKIDKGKANVRTLVNPVTKNWIETKPKAVSLDAATGIGRGNTAPIQWYDELEFTPYVGTIIATSGPAYIRASETADRLGAYHCRIFTTTTKQFLVGSMVTSEREAC